MTSASPPREIVLCDPYLSGHHLSYLRIYSSVFLNSGCKVTVFCEDVERVGRYLSDLSANHGGRFRILGLHKRVFAKIEKNNNKRKGLVRDLVESYSVFKNFKQIGDSARAHGISRDSLVFIMWLDSCISKYLLPVFLRYIMPYQWGGLFFHPGHVKHDRQKDSSFRDLLHYIPVFDSKKLVFVGLFDKCMVDKLTTKQKRKIFKWLPDVAEENPLDLDAELVKDILHAAGGRKIVSLVGSLGKRKNLMSYLEVVRNCDNKELFYVCAGQLHKENFNGEELNFIYKTAEDCRAKLLFYDKHIETDEVFDTIFYLSTVIVAVYDRFVSSSNMITKAANYKKGIVVAEGFLMGEIVNFYKIGLCVKSGDTHALHEAIEKLSDENLIGPGSFEAYTKEYSVSCLNKQLSMLS